MTDLDDRARFITEFARRLHLAGVSAARLEGAVQSTARSIGVDCEIWSSPTGILLSIDDPAVAGVNQQTRVLRLEPAQPNLSDLVTLDEISEDVIAGQIGVVEAWSRMRALDRELDRNQLLWTVFAFGLASAAVAGLLRTSWGDVIAAGVLGLVVGAIAVYSRTRPHITPAFEAIAAVVAYRAGGGIRALRRAALHPDRHSCRPDRAHAWPHAHDGRLRARIGSSS
jgi:uncharacterized membrane protein YjjP (DUF1212 family)